MVEARQGGSELDFADAEQSAFAGDGIVVNVTPAGISGRWRLLEQEV